MKKCKGVPSEKPITPWKLEVEFNDTLRCKLYSQLSFAEEKDEPTVPPTSPVQGFKYAPLIKPDIQSAYKSTQDVIDHLYSPYEDSDVQTLYSKGSNFLYESHANTDKVDNVPDAKPSLLLRYIKRCNKEKLRSIEDSYVTKSYSGESIFLKDGIDDVNEGKNSNVLQNSTDHDPKKTKMHIWKPKKSVKLNVSLNHSRKTCEKETLQNKSKDFLRSDTIDRIGDECADLQTSLCTLYKPSKGKGISKYTLTKTDKTQSITKKSISSDEEENILSNVWKHALLANRSSYNSSFSNYSIPQYKQPNTRYNCEKYTFLKSRNVLKNNYRSGRSLNASKIFKFTTSLRNNPHLYESSLSIV